MTVRFFLDPTGPARLVSSPRAQAIATQAARSIAEGAAASAPVRTGRAQRSYKSTPAEVTPQGNVIASAYTDDVAGHLIEFGSINNAPYRPLTRGAARAGVRLKVSGKGES